MRNFALSFLNSYLFFKINKILNFKYNYTFKKTITIRPHRGGQLPNPYLIITNRGREREREVGVRKYKRKQQMKNWQYSKKILKENKKIEKLVVKQRKESSQALNVAKEVVVRKLEYTHVYTYEVNSFLLLLLHDNEPTLNKTIPRNLIPTSCYLFFHSCRHKLQHASFLFNKLSLEKKGR